MSGMQAQFEKMGATVKERVVQRQAPRMMFEGGRIVPAPRGSFSINVRHGVFTVDKDKDVEPLVIDAKPKDRHLLLMVKTGKTHQKFLCGHDERDWFVASVKPTVTSVAQAKDSLRPAPVGEALLKAGVPARKRNKRHNKAYIRQGEWFFVPAPELVADKLLILRNEPLVRAGGGKPHMIEELFRRGGVTVHVHRRLAPQGVLPAEFKRLSKEDATNWTVMRRNPEAFARGAVRHADHATVHLSGWHRIHMNGEVRSANLGFLD